MIARYRIVRGKRSADDPLPDGIRQDTRKHTKHPLRPEPESVSAFLESQQPDAFERFRESYVTTLTQRFAKNRQPFDKLAELARNNDVYLGCNCPTRLQPNVQHCHTSLALDWLRQQYPDLAVCAPSTQQRQK